MNHARGSFTFCLMRSLFCYLAQTAAMMWKHRRQNNTTPTAMTSSIDRRRRYAYRGILFFGDDPPRALLTQHKFRNTLKCWGINFEEISPSALAPAWCGDEWTMAMHPWTLRLSVDNQNSPSNNLSDTDTSLCLIFLDQRYQSAYRSVFSINESLSKIME